VEGERVVISEPSNVAPPLINPPLK